MKQKGRIRILSIVLILLASALVSLIIIRIRPSFSSGVPSGTSEPASAEVSPVPSPLPASAKPLPSALPSPAAPPLPSPSPTPRPLREVSLCEDNLDESLFLPAKEKGTVSLVQYLTEDRVSGGGVEIMKDLAVYLPFGYDEQKQYNVLILLHCAWADHRFWLAEDREYRTEDGSIPVSVPNMLDRMIEEGWCEPLIVVSPCIYLYDHQPSAVGNSYDYLQFSREFGQDLLPFLAEHYATFAADGSRKALADAREHFGLLGASFGAYAEYISVIGDSFDLAAWYTFCGGGAIDPGYLISSWENAGTQDYPLRLLYISEGEFDDRYDPEHSFYNLLYYGEYYGGPFSEENIRYTMVRGWGHEDHSYLVGLFNTLQLFFRT